MSADNWATCPRCKKNFDADHQKQVDKVAKSYGKIPADEYTRMAEALKNKPEDKQTLREDYELWIDSDGVFKVRYSGYCQACDFNFVFKHEEDAKQ